MKNVCFGFLFMANFCNFTVLYNDLKISEEHREPLEIVANRVAGPHFLSVCSSSSKKFSFIQLMEAVNCEDCPAVAEFIYHIYTIRGLPSSYYDPRPTFSRLKCQAISLIIQLNGWEMHAHSRRPFSFHSHRWLIDSCLTIK